MLSSASSDSFAPANNGSLAIFSRANVLRLLLVILFSLAVASAGINALPPLDRDEARFAQATTQMLETGDYVNIRFQDQERNKKPVGIYWLQAASVELVSSAKAREIWAYRLPSLISAVIASAFTFLAALRLYGPNTALLSGLLMAAAPGLAGEATIAKTDAALLASIVMTQTAFIYVIARAYEGRAAGWVWPLIFWSALGLGILLKGPIAPMVTGLTAVALLARNRQAPWLRALRPLIGLVIVTLIVAPWAILIGLETDGRFYTEALGGDMLSKVGAAQESHSGPPGYYLILLWALFWPASALIAPGVACAIASRRAWPSFFLLAWIVPSWLIFEITATKLPHYTLPLYPALAILAARAANLGATKRRIITRRVGAGVYFIVGLAVSIAIVLLPLLFGEDAAAAFEGFSLKAMFTSERLILAALVFAATCGATLLFWRGDAYRGGFAAAAASGILAFTLLEGVLPSLDQLKLSPSISAALDDLDRHPIRDGAPPPVLAGYYEPSAVFLIGTNTILTNGDAAAAHLAKNPGAAAIIEAKHQQAFATKAQALGIAPKPVARIDGFNYSKGDWLTLTLYIIDDQQIAAKQAALKRSIINRP